MRLDDERVAIDEDNARSDGQRRNESGNDASTSARWGQVVVVMFGWTMAAGYLLSSLAVGDLSSLPAALTLGLAIAILGNINRWRGGRGLRP